MTTAKTTELVSGCFGRDEASGGLVPGPLLGTDPDRLHPGPQGLPRLVPDLRSHRAARATRGELEMYVRHLESRGYAAATVARRVLIPIRTTIGLGDQNVARVGASPPLIDRA